jgi:DNA-directed RNA polymerase specialized sigma24 family protein
MTTANLSAFLRRLTRGMVAATLADQSDRQLVERFLAGQDEAVFDAIVRRHGAMVYRVCWRVLQHHQNAEDAFRATFLVLAQRLRTVRKHASLASWLHGRANGDCRLHLGQGRSSNRRSVEDHVGEGN